MSDTEIMNMIADMVKKNLRIQVDSDTHVYTNQPQIVVTILWGGAEIDSDIITLEAK